MNKKYLIGVIGVIIVVGIVATFFLGGSGVKKNPDDLVIALSPHNGEPEAGFDPIQGWDYFAEPLIQSTLFKRDNKMNLVNNSAIGYTVSSDRLTYDITLRNDIKFHDNTMLTAKDVAFTYNRTRDVGASGVDLSNMNSSTALNDTVVEFKLSKPDSTFISKLCYLGIVPEASYSNDTYGKKPIGSGPYKFVQWDKGQQLILEVNDEYYGKKPEFKKLTILFLSDDAAFAASNKREVDVSELPLSFANKTVNNMTMTLIPALDTRGISLPYLPNNGSKTSGGNDLGNNVTSDLAIRKALNYGIDRQSIIDGPLYGHGLKSFDGVASTLPWSNSEAEIKDGDVDEAKKILADGGWTDTDGDGIVEKNGLKAVFELYYFSTDQDRETIAMKVSEEAKKLGIEIIPVGKSNDEVKLKINSQPTVMGFGDTDPSRIYHLYDSKLIGKGWDNPSGYNNSISDGYIGKAMNDTNLESSYTDWRKVSWDGASGTSPKGDASWLWLVSLEFSYLVDNTLNISTETATLQPHGGDLFGNICDWKRIKAS